MAFSIAFHSYKGGTGKTTIASNLAAYLAKNGFTVCLLDLDVYAPSMQVYFDIEPKRSINDFLFHDSNIEDVMIDFTDTTNIDYNNNKFGSSDGSSNNSIVNISDRSDSINTIIDFANSKLQSQRGKLLIGFSSTKKQEIQKLESGTSELKKQIFRKLIMFREQLISKYNPDYIIIDTSPGIRYWSLNALAIADIFILTLKMGDIDIKGTKTMVSEIYDSFTKYGTKCFLLWNIVAGYCSPPPLSSFSSLSFINNNSKTNNSFSSLNVKDNVSKNRYDFNTESIEKTENVEYMLSREVGMKIISSIPCFCDIQFIRKEFLTALRFLNHPFAKKIELLANSIDKEKAQADAIE